MRRLLSALPWLILTALLALLLLAGILLVREQWQRNLAFEQKAGERELQLLASLVRNDLQIGNYQHIDELLNDWGRNNADTKSLKLTAENGHIISEYLRPTATAHPAVFASAINYSYRGAAQLEIIKSFDDVYRQRIKFIWKAGTVYALVTLLLIVLTCVLLKYRQKSRALQKEAERRQHAETALQHERNQLEETVTARTAQLAAINRELEAFSYSVSHDLRAPLRAIDGFSLALLEDYADRLDEIGHDYLRRVRSGAQKMGLLIDDLLQLSRVTRSELHLQEIDLSQLASTIIAELRQSEAERTVTITIAPQLQAYGDPTLLQVLLANLLGNAWKFTRRQPKANIEFGLLPDHDEQTEQTFFICDNGVGFDMKYIHKLFIAFQRLHGFEQFEGTGIGLATVQRIINKHSGRIWVEAAPDNGATFYFTLPSTGKSEPVDSNQEKAVYNPT